MQHIVGQLSQRSPAHRVRWSVLRNKAVHDQRQLLTQQFSPFDGQMTILQQSWKQRSREELNVMNICCDPSQRIEALRVQEQNVGKMFCFMNVASPIDSIPFLDVMSHAADDCSNSLRNNFHGKHPSKNSWENLTQQRKTLHVRKNSERIVKVSRISRQCSMSGQRCCKGCHLHEPSCYSSHHTPKYYPRSPSESKHVSATVVETGQRQSTSSLVSTVLKNATQPSTAQHFLSNCAAGPLKAKPLSAGRRRAPNDPRGDNSTRRPLEREKKRAKMGRKREKGRNFGRSRRRGGGERKGPRPKKKRLDNCTCTQLQSD